MTGDDDTEMRKRKSVTVWDKKSKKYVKVQDDKKKIKTESGVYISATYKTNRYNKWKERTKIAQQVNDEDEDDQRGGGRGMKRPNTQLPSNHPAMKKANNAVRKNKNEIQRPEQIMKKRRMEEKKAQKHGKGKKPRRR